MYGTSDAGYQAKLGRLTDEEVKANEAATAAHHEFAVKLFMGGVEARSGTSEQVACTAELLWLITKHPRLTDGDTELPVVIGGKARWGCAGAGNVVARHDRAVRVWRCSRQAHLPSRDDDWHRSWECRAVSTLRAAWDL